MHLLLKDDTGETKVMLLDTIAEPIVGVSADELLNGSLEEVNSMLSFYLQKSFVYSNELLNGPFVIVYIVDGGS